MIARYRKVIVINLFIILFGLATIYTIRRSVSVTRVEEETTETNPLRLAQHRVDFPIMMLHHPEARLVKFFYPKSRNFADEVLGIGFLYTFRDLEIRLFEVYRDINPLAHTFDDYKTMSSDGKSIKIRETQGHTSLVWYDDVGVFRLEGASDLETLTVLYKHVSSFTPLDEKTISSLREVYEGQEF